MINPGANTFANMSGRSGIASQGIKPVSTNITFSVGTAAPTSDAYITKEVDGSNPLVTIENGTARFSTPQTNDYFGVGDKVILSDATEFYIGEKVSTSEWVVLNSSGNSVQDIQSETEVVSIDKAFNSLYDAIHGDSSGIFSLLGTHDLESINSSLRISCYAMSDDLSEDSVAISDLWVTSKFGSVCQVW